MMGLEWDRYMAYKTNQSGLTLIELLISMALSGVLLALMVLAFNAQSRSYNTQQEISVLQEDMKAALQLMSRDIRMVGYDPQGTAGAKIETLTGMTVFRASEDLNGDGTLSASETIQYSLVGTSLVRMAGAGNQPVIDNVTHLAFEYLTITSGGATAPWNSVWMQNPGATDLQNIREVKVCIQGRTARQTSTMTDTSTINPPSNTLGQTLNWTPANPGKYQYRTLCVQVGCRNLQLF